jgi:chemotaxis protein methyltransferase CheR
LAQPWRPRARESGSDVVRVWSVACATGEEPYSLALLACEAFASTSPPVRILASDVSTAALASATDGRYRDRSAQGVEEPLRSRYLTRTGDRLVVIPALRELVVFAPHNLVSDAYPPPGEAPFHLILCRNVLIYFDGETCRRVVTGLERALAPGGRLVLGAADALCALDRAAGEFLREPARRNPAPPPSRERRTRPARPVVLPPLASSQTNEDLMRPDVHYLRGLAELESGDGHAAVSSLRRVLYLDPEFELAAFALGRAHERAGEPDAARRRYEQALRMLDARPVTSERLAGPIDAATVIDACEARLAALSSPSRLPHTKDTWR